MVRALAAKHDEHVGHLLWEVSSRATAIAEARLAGSALSLPSLGVLDVIAETPGIAIAEIARRSPKTQQAISQVVARLEKLGLVERRLVGARTIGLHLTPAGVRAQAEGAQTEVACERELEGILGHDRYERLRKALLDVRSLLHPAAAARPARTASSTSRSRPRRKARR
jgi:DNA-binding MarR family transcriptional regulator